MTVIPMPTHCVINVHETGQPWHFAGTFEDCWRHLLKHYGKCYIKAVISMGWKIQRVRQTCAA